MDRATASVPDGRATSAESLSECECEILSFERQWWKYAGAKETAIRDLFAMSATRYYQTLNALIDRPEALARAEEEREQVWPDGAAWRGSHLEPSPVGERRAEAREQVIGGIGKRGGRTRRAGRQPVGDGHVAAVVDGDT